VKIWDALRSNLRAEARDRSNLVLAPLAVAILIGSWWGLPGPDSWSADSVSPRTCGLGAIVETYWPGHYHNYPPLHTALLTVLSLPWMGLAALHAGTGQDALAAELVKPFYMSIIEASARVLAALMAFATVWNTKKLWTRILNERAGIVAALTVSLNATYVYYAHTGNLEVPYLFWLSWALLEIDRVATGEAREKQVLLLAVAATLTKDQAAAALLIPLPIYLVLIPRIARNTVIFRRNLIVASLIAIGAFLVASGAVINPSGFHKRLDYLFGPASKPWAEVPPGLIGSLMLVKNAVLVTPRFVPWPVAILALAGIGHVLFRKKGLERMRLLLPFFAALSFWIFFNMGARRTEDRFLLPESIFLAPYLAVTFDAACEMFPTRIKMVVAGCALAMAPALLAIANVDATLLADPRYAAEDWIDALPNGTHVEVYGSAQFLPRLGSNVVASRPGIEPIGDRRHIDGVAEILDPDLDPRPRHPTAIILATELSTDAMTSVDSGPAPPVWMSYRDPKSHAFFRGLSDGSLAYRRALVAKCELPWPLTCREIHHSTAGEVWIYVAEE
jgi:hypothetical protein